MVVLIAVSGPTSSGKSTVVRNLASVFGDKVAVVHQDDFYKPDGELRKVSYDITEADGTTRTLVEDHWDEPEAINFDRLVQCLTEARQLGQLPEWYESQHPAPEEAVTSDLARQLWSRVESDDKAKNDGERNPRVILVDGFMLLHDPAIANLFDIRIFLHASYETLVARRKARPLYVTSGGVMWADPPQYFERVVWPAYENNHQAILNNRHESEGYEPVIKISTENMDVNDMTRHVFDHIAPYL
ncbi:P-loop containing nucleoside triphosphate hydrolase protein [Ramicandelaber brevisporus]|nr:P-loop containing nucleoside triphosphate hydrolase protein [Ramicandelaber brevisporus]